MVNIAKNEESMTLKNKRLLQSEPVSNQGRLSEVNF